LIYNHRRTQFGRICVASRRIIKRSWEGLFASPDGRDFKQLHPSLKDKTPDQLATSIPIVIHEDAAPYGKKRSVSVLQWGPLITNGSDIESRFVHHGYIVQKPETPEIARPSWDRFWEDIDQMTEGKDKDGIPIAKDPDGTVWKFEFLFCENDFEMDQTHGLPNYGRGRLFCKHCRVIQSTKKML